ncbi:uncharacterized protein LOC136079279 [Hydra vulgaris]|uniref:Uncharacterized protein LOC136079279 n=1 Tax=Hydra vulgaris TaxID=6087 RepID=A0ABM4BPP1_HYDVU
MPKHVSRCGRPKGSTLTTIGLPRKRQPNLHERRVPFLKLHPSKRHAMMLGWFLKPDDVHKTLSGILIEGSCIEKRVNHISSAILDENAVGALLSLQEYFTPDGWKVLHELIDAKSRQKIWPCAVCQKSTCLGNDIGDSVGCDLCLLWFHKKCVGQKEGYLLKSKYWFCHSCYLLCKRKKCQPKNVAKYYIQRKIDQEGFLKVKINESIGYGVFATNKFLKGDFLLQYRGDVISLNEAKFRSQQYENKGLGCFIYNGIKDIYGKSVCIDATNQLSFMGCMVNGSPSIYANAEMKRIVESNYVSLCLFATKTIDGGTELRYDYGDKVKKMFWRTMASCLQPLCYNQANYVEIGAINRENLDVLKVTWEKPLFDDSDSEIEYQYQSPVDIITESSFKKCDLIVEKENELVCSSPNKETEFIAILPSLITTSIIERCASWEELKTFTEASNSNISIMLKLEQ